MPKTDFRSANGTQKKLSFIISNQWQTDNVGANPYTAVCIDPTECGLVLFDQKLRHLTDNVLNFGMHRNDPRMHNFEDYMQMNFDALIKNLLKKGIPPINKILLAFTLYGEKYELNSVVPLKIDEFQRIFLSCDAVCGWTFEYQKVGKLSEFKSIFFIVRPGKLYQSSFELTAHIERLILASHPPNYADPFKRMRNCVYLTYELLKNWENQFVTEK